MTRHLGFIIAFAILASTSFAVERTAQVTTSSNIATFTGPNCEEGEYLTRRSNILVCVPFSTNAEQGRYQAGGSSILDTKHGCFISSRGVLEALGNNSSQGEVTTLPEPTGIKINTYASGPQLDCSYVKDGPLDTGGRH